MAKDRIQWQTIIYAPTYYNVELVPSECFWFWDQHAKQRMSFSGSAGSGWRRVGSETIGGSPGNPIPTPLGVKVTWLSLTENKFYHAVLILPRELIIQEFEKKIDVDFDIKRFNRKYTEMQIAISPGGFISLRLGWAKTKEIAHTQAQVADITWDFFKQSNRYPPSSLTQEKYINTYLKSLPPYIIQQVKKKEFPINRWKNYCTKLFPWYITTNMDLYGYFEYLVNGDQHFISRPDLNLSKKDSIPKAAPAWYKWYFKENGKRYQAFINFSKNDTMANERPDDDLQIFEIFQKYFQNSKHPTALNIQKTNDKITVYLDNGHQKQPVPLEEYKILLIDDVKKYPWF